MKLLKLIALVVLAGYSGHAQKYDLGEVTKEELEQKTHPQDPSAPAAILFTRGETYFNYNENEGGFQLITEVETKIKIYNKDGYDWANKIVQLYTSDTEKESVDVSKAVTYNLVDGVVKKTKLKSDGEFDEQANKYWKLHKIVMPDVKEGSIIEYKYVVKSPFISILPEWKFQESIPVNYSEYKTKIPEYYTYNKSFRGYIPPKVTSTKMPRSIMFTSKERSDGYITKTTFSSDKVDFMEEQTTYALQNLPGLKDESFVNNIENYTSSVEHELAMTKYPNSTAKHYSTTWEDVVKTIYDYGDFGPELNKSGYYEDDVTVLIAGLTTPQEKAGAIFNYVKNRMNWNGFHGYSCESGVRRAYNDKVGNVADINLMLTSMLRYAGLNADPVLVSTRSNKIALYANRSAFNYVIASVEIDGKILLMDATSKSALPGILPVRAINWEGRRIRKDGTSTRIDLVPGWLSKEVVNLAVQLDKDGNISGKAREQYFDYNAYLFRENLAGVNKDVYIEKMEKEHTGMQVGEYKVTYDDMSKPVIEEYDFTHNQVSDIIGDKIYLNPLLFLTATDNPFKQEKREYPIDFVFPHQDRYLVNITLPEGYVVEMLPQPVAIAMEENIGTFKYNIGQNNNQLQIVMTLDINYATVPQDYYITIRDFYQKVIEKQNEKIILKKA